MWTNTSLPPSFDWTKPKPLFSSNHLTLPVTRDGRRRVGRACGAAAAALSNERCGARSAAPRRVDLEHASDLRALHAVRNLHLELGAGGTVSYPADCRAPICRNASPVPLRKLDEAEALVGLEPFHDGVDRGRRRRRAPCPESRRGRRPGAAEWRALGTVGARCIIGGSVVVEAALAGPRKSRPLLMRSARFSAYPGEPPVRTQKGARRPTTPERPKFSLKAIHNELPAAAHGEGRNASCPRATFVAGAGQPGYWIPVTLRTFLRPVWQKIQ